MVARRLLVWGTMALACATGCGAQEAPGGTGGEPEVRIRAWVERAFDPALTPGLAVAVVRGDETLFLDGLGVADVATGRPVTAETPFYIASVTKSFVGMLAAHLHDEGAIDLQGSVTDHLPGVAWKPPLDGSAIRLEQLLTHTHGIGADGGGVAGRLAYTGVWTHDQLVELLGHADPLEAEDRFEYSNIGYNVFGLALAERFNGFEWQQLLDSFVLQPMGLRATTPYISRVDPSSLARPHRLEPEGPAPMRLGKQDSNMHAAGGLVSNAGDLARWMRINLNAGEVGGTRVFPAATIAEAQRPRVDAPMRDPEGFGRDTYALGLHRGTLEGEPSMHHFGSFPGYHADVSYLPERHLGIAVLANTAGGGNFVSSAVAKGIYAILMDRPNLDAYLDELIQTQRQNKEGSYRAVTADRERRASRSQALPHPLTAYTGVYAHEALGRVEFRIHRDQLLAQAGVSVSDVEVFDGAKNQLRVELGGRGTVAAFAFERGDRATSVELLGVLFRRVH